MKKIIIFLTLTFLSIWFTNAGIFDDAIQSNAKTQICDDEGECWLIEWIELKNHAINYIQTQWEAAKFLGSHVDEYFQMYQLIGDVNT